MQILCLLTSVVRNKLTLQCKISDNKFKSKGTAQLWLQTTYVSADSDTLMTGPKFHRNHIVTISIGM